MSGKTHFDSWIEIHKLILSDKAMIKEDFTPYQFLSSKANVQPGIIEGDKRIVMVNGQWQTMQPSTNNSIISESSKDNMRTIYILFSVAILIVTGFLFLFALRNRKYQGNNKI
jgi:hypothetical protein